MTLPDMESCPICQRRIQRDRDGSRSCEVGHPVIRWWVTEQRPIEERVVYTVAYTLIILVAMASCFDVLGIRPDFVALPAGALAMLLCHRFWIASADILPPEIWEDDPPQGGEDEENEL